MSTSNLLIVSDTNRFYSALLFDIPEFNSLTSVDMALVTLSAATSKSFLKDRPKLLLALLEPLPGKLFVLNADLTSKISIFLARSNFQIKIIFLNRNCSMQFFYCSSIIIPLNHNSYTFNSLLVTRNIKTYKRHLQSFKLKLANYRL